MTLNPIAQLADELKNHDVPYCSFKSNFFIAEAFDGQRDIDLLVERRALSEAIRILLDLGFKPALPRSSESTLGQHHYYGWQLGLDCLLHVHLFNHIVTGESLVKSHVFPLDQVLLQETYEIDGIRVASKSAELLLYVLRMFVKHGSLFDLAYGMRGSVDVHHELPWLQDGSDAEQTVGYLEECCPVIDRQLFFECIETLGANGSLLRRIRLARKVKRQLRVYARHSPLGRIVAYGKRYWGELLRRLRLLARGKMLQAGGVVIAFVGPDAVGKSTLVSECGRWLGRAFSVRTVHVGRPKASLLTIPINIALSLARGLGWQSRGRSVGNQAALTEADGSRRKAGGLFELLYALRALGLAWDRRRVLVRARRSAANGEIVVCDRYPSDIVGSMDSRRLVQKPVGDGVVTGIYNHMARLEERFYRQVPPPDIVLRLRASAAVAKERNRMRDISKREDETALEARHHQYSGWQLSGAKYVCDLDTEGELADTINHAKALIWERL